MKIAIITDTHYGARKGSKLFHDYFEKFYDEIFFPTLEDNNITTIVHMGDAFDSRKSIDYQSLEWTKRVIFDRLSKYKVHMIVGNHDSYYKNTNSINSPELILRDYPNVITYSSPTEIKLDNINLLLIPWICLDNESETMSIISKTKCNVVMGHLELKGFRINKTLPLMDHGLDSTIFNKFDRVFSGHYHTRSDNGKIFYLGNPYELYWNDLNDTRGFVIFDTDTLEHTYINNPFKMFYSIYYEDTPYQVTNMSEFTDKIVRVIVKKKTNPSDFEKFIDKIYESNVAELKIIESFELDQSEDFEILESEDTFSILNRYIEESEVTINKSFAQKLMKDIYQEACEMI